MGAMTKPAVLFNLDIKTVTKYSGRGGSALALPGGASAQFLLLALGELGHRGALGVGSAPLQLQELSSPLTAPGAVLVLQAH